MDIAVADVVVGFLVSTVGFSVFLYGKKQSRLPQLLAGGLMMLLPLVVPGALWIGVAGCAALGALWVALQTEGGSDRS